MKACVRVLGPILTVLLLLLSSTACWGGAMLIAEAHRNPLGLMAQSASAHALLLGIVLFGAVGVPGVWALWVNLRHEPTSGFWSALEGVVLLGWLTAECLFSHTLLWLHYVYGALGLFLIFSGIVLSQSRSRSSAQWVDRREQLGDAKTTPRLELEQ